MSAYPSITNNLNYITVNDKKINIILSVNLPRVVVLEKFLSDSECDELVELSKTRLKRSNTVDNSTGDLQPHPSRTSSGMFFSRGENDLVKIVEERISKVINWPVDHGEGLQILHYERGQQYLPHNDYFNSSHPGTKHIISRGGNRVATFIIYLSTPEHGGSTSFPESGIKVQAIKGNALFFEYSSKDSTSKTLHGGDPVIMGEKYVATKWLREGVFK